MTDSTLAGPVFVLPFGPATAASPTAGVYSAAALVRSAESLHGAAAILSPEGWLPTSHIETFEWSEPSLRTGVLRRVVPRPVKSVLHDIRHLLSMRGLNRRLAAAGATRLPLYVWQRHAMGFDAGRRIARRAGVPLVVSVHAVQMAEGERWGNRRPKAWRDLLGARAERELMDSADLVACVTEEVRSDVLALGIEPQKVVVVPNAVDVEQFRPRPDLAETVRSELGIPYGQTVVGWVGNFHHFHNVELLVRSVAQVDSDHVTLLLVGTGPEVPRVRELVSSCGLAPRSIMTGAVPHDQVSRLVNAMDVAAVVPATHENFHYSPVKLREYLACGRAVIAPGTGEPARMLTDGENALLVQSQDELSGAIQRLQEDDALRTALGTSARKLATRLWSWDATLRRMEDELWARADRASS